MAIRLPLQNILSFNDSGDVGGGSVAGVFTKTFTIPQDSDGVVVKLQASIVGGTGVSATLQTTDDGGTTWFDCARTSTVLTTVNATAQWMAVPVFGMGYRTGVVGTSVVATGSVQSFGSVAGATGSAAASSLGVLSISGLPILSQLGRIALIYSGNVTTNDQAKVDVYVSSQSASHN